MTTPDEIETLLLELDQADDRLRSVYRSLADDPRLADERDLDLAALRAERAGLVQGLGLAVLARHRARPRMTPILRDDERGAEQLPKNVATASAGELPPSAAIVDEWKRSVRENGFGHTRYEDRFAVPWEMALNKLMIALGKARSLDLEIDDELDALDAVGRDPLAAEWSKLPRHAQRSWLGHLVARTRAVKEIEGLSAARRARVKTIISRYPPWASEHQPGFVHGLDRTHEPQGASWSADAESLWRELRNTHVETGSESPQAITRAARSRPKDSREGDSVDSVRTIDPNWSLLGFVRGRRALMAGGDPREPNRERLERFFGFASLEWPDITGPRRTDAVISRIRSGTIDLVVVLRGFVDHKQSEPIIAAAKANDVPWALAEGYGATSMMSALERFCSNVASPDANACAAVG